MWSTITGRFVTVPSGVAHLYSAIPTAGPVRSPDSARREVYPNAMDKPVLLTRDGLAKLERELAELRTTGRSEIAERIKYAKDFGDISENAEYDDAKNDQGMLEGRILVLENMLRNAVIIEEGAGNGTVGVGSAVEVKDEFGKQSFTIVGPAEVDVAEGRISMESPVGKALLGHKVGDQVEVQSPGGTRKLKIVKIG